MISANDLISIIESGNNQNEISNIIREILVLEDKLSNSDSKSFYFKMGIENQKEKLFDLKVYYSEIKEEFNKISVEKLIELTVELQEEINERLNKVGMMNAISISSLKSKLNQAKDFITVKSYFDKLKDIEEYTTEELKVFFK
jgi:hypothetical protein